MPFNVGDRVRVTSLGFGIAPDDDIVGEEYKIKFLIPGEPFSIRLEGSPYCWHESLLELVGNEIRVGDTVELLDISELPENATSGDIAYQQALRKLLDTPMIVDNIAGSIFIIQGHGYWKERFKKAGAISNPNSKYSKVIRKIKEMKSRREKLGYKY
jgi:hypothetical protein